MKLLFSTLSVALLVVAGLTRPAVAQSRAGLERPQDSTTGRWSDRNKGLINLVTAIHQIGGSDRKAIRTAMGLLLRTSVLELEVPELGLSDLDRQKLADRLTETRDLEELKKVLLEKIAKQEASLKEKGERGYRPKGEINR